MDGGAGRDRTGDLRLAKAALYQLSYSPILKRRALARPPPGALVRASRGVVGLSGFEPLTSRLSAVRSSQLSYRPVVEGRALVDDLPCCQRATGRLERRPGGSLKAR